MEISEQKVIDIFSKFDIEAKTADVKPVNVGIINSTYDVIINEDKRYILQKINSFVFKNPEHIMRNIGYVTDYISEKNPNVVHLTYMEMSNGKNYYFDSSGSFWRICNYIDSVTYNTVDSLEIIKNAGKAFGEFQKYLDEFDSSKLYETIKDFHNTKLRLDNFFDDVDSDICNRVSKVKDEIEFIKSIKDKASKLSLMQSNNELPLRVTHNDTKINNVLFEKDTENSIAVIDLDTVMPGLMAYDFGDAVRSCCNESSEDESDLAKVIFNLEKFKAFSDGFIGVTKDIMTEEELETITLGAFTMATELGVRFLDDYITGDMYFKIKYPEHNLIRARGQLKLAKDILEKMDEMQKIIKNI